MSFREFESCRIRAKDFNIANIDEKIKRFNFYLRYHT